MVGAVVAGGGAVLGLIGASNSASAAKSAANTQAQAANNAAQLQLDEYQATARTLSPFVQAGQNNVDAFSNFYRPFATDMQNASALLAQHIPQPMTEANLVNTPGYSFNLSQGLRAVQNSNAAQGLGVSGSALQGAAKYATGLADSTYQNQFNNQQAQFANYQQLFNNEMAKNQGIFNTLQAPVTLGENAAAMTGNIGQQAAANAGSAIQQAGIAQSAGITGAANAFNSGLQGITNAGYGYLGYQNAFNRGGGGGYVDNSEFTPNAY